MTQPTLRLPAPHPPMHRRCNRLAAWPGAGRLFGLRSHEKRLPSSVFALPNEQVALFLSHLWAADGSVTRNGLTDHAEICYVSSSRRLVDDIMQLLLRLNVCSRIVRVRKSGRRYRWHVYVDGAGNQAAFLRNIGARSESAQRVLGKLEARSEALATTGITQPATAVNTRFTDARTTFVPDRRRLHGMAATREDREICASATSDVLWDKIVEITSAGEHDVYDGTVLGTSNFVAQGVSVHNSLEQDADMVILLHRPDAFERDDPRGGEADLILAKHRNGPTKTVTVAHQLHLSRFANMAR
jgi:replicative DNA helicase